MVHLEWSTIVDAPVTYGMSLKEFREYYKQQYPNYPDFSFTSRMERVREKGISAFDYNNVDELVDYNRAGYNEKCLTKDEIIEWYCIEREDPPENIGVIIKNE